MKTLLFFLLCSSLGLAQVISVDTSRTMNEHVKSMSLQDQWVYQFVLHVCQGNKIEIFQQSLTQSFKTGLDLWALDTMRMQKFFGRHFTGQYIEIIFSSLAFPYAMRQCFPGLSQAQQQAARDRFITELLVLDFVGNTVGFVGGTVGISKLFGVISSSLNKFAWKPIKRQLKQRRHWTDDQIKWLDRVVKYGSATAAVGYIGYDKYQINRKSAEGDARVYEMHSKSLREISDMLNKIKILAKESEDKDFWESALERMSQQKTQTCQMLIQHSKSLYEKDKISQDICR